MIFQVVIPGSPPKKIELPQGFAADNAAQACLNTTHPGEFAFSPGRNEPGDTPTMSFAWSGSDQRIHVSEAE